MQVIVLASGRGRRLIPITDYHPKPLLPVANRPLLDYLLTAVTKAGFTEIFVTFGYAGDQVQQYLQGSPWPSSLQPVLASNWAQGPLASFLSVLPQLAADTPCVLIPGDLYISTTNLRQLLATSAEVALLYDPEIRRPGTLLQVDASHQIHGLVQSPAYLPEYYSGLPALRATPEFFEHTIATCKGEPSTVFDLLHCWLAQGQSVQGIPIAKEGWYDVDTAADLVALNYHLLTTAWPPTPTPLGTYLPPNTSKTGPMQTATLTLGEGSLLEGPLLLGDRVQIGANCVIRDGTSLGAQTTIQSNTELSRCITLAHTQVPPNAELTAAVLDTKGNALH